MGKRTNFESDAAGAHANKRQRVEGGHERNDPRPNGAGAEEVHSARDLQKVLYFDQNATNDFRNGICPNAEAPLCLTDLRRPDLVQTVPRLNPLPDRHP